MQKRNGKKYLLKQLIFDFILDFGSAVVKVDLTDLEKGSPKVYVYQYKIFNQSYEVVKNRDAVVGRFDKSNLALLGMTKVCDAVAVLAKNNGWHMWSY